MKEVYLKTRRQWRNWLIRNHAREDGIWLVFYKKDTGMPTLAYDDAVEEALCFGWIDSIIRRLDEDRFARKMTPRRDNSRWSAANVERVERLVERKLMTRAGLQKMDAAKKSGRWKPVRPPEICNEIPPELQRALSGNRKARDYFDRLAPSRRKHYIAWVAVAKRPETRLKRARETIRLLEQGKKLGLK